VLKRLVLALALALCVARPAHAQVMNPDVRIKDIAHIQGSASNNLIGYGLVVGLNNAGDTSLGTGITNRTVANMLERMGAMVVRPEDIRSRNVAAVVITGSMPPYGAMGDAMDITVSSIGDARSLQGGTLLMTQLKAADGKVYALAQGSLSTGGFNPLGGGGAAGALGVRMHTNHELVGRIPNGGSLVRDVPHLASQDGGQLTINLNSPDATTASKMAQAIRAAGFNAEAVNPSTIRLEVPPPTAFSGNRVDLIARIEQLTLRPDTVAKVVINERTGTVVMGGDVRLGPVAIAHGNLRLVINQTPPAAAFGARGTYAPSRPMGGIGGAPQTYKAYSVMSMPLGATLRDVTDALNTIGVTPRDLIAIVQALKTAGALDAVLQMQQIWPPVWATGSGIAGNTNLRRAGLIR